MLLTIIEYMGYNMERQKQVMRVEGYVAKETKKLIILVDKNGTQYTIRKSTVISRFECE